jgi:PAS domain S-box-containing protein
LPQSLIPSEFNRELFDHIPHHVWFTADANGQMLFFNQVWQNFTGLSVNQMSGAELMTLVHPEDQKALNHAWREAITKKSPLDIIARIRDKNLRWCWMRILAQPVFRDGKVLTWVGTNADIDELKKFHEKNIKLQHQQQLLQKLSLEVNKINTIQAICEHFIDQNQEIFGDHSARISYLIAPKTFKVVTAFGLFGKSLTPNDIWEIEDESTVALMLKTRKPIFLELDPALQQQELLKTNQLKSLFLLPIVTQQGIFGEIRLGFEQEFHDMLDEIPLFLTVAEILSRGIERILLIQDLKNLNATLEKQVVERTAQLNQHVRELEAFVFSASHDLRAPMSVLLAAGRRIRESSPTNSPMVRVADSIQNAVGRMNEMLITMLDLARGHQQLKVGQLNIRRSFEQVLQNLEPAITARQIQIEQDIKADFVCCLESDFYQILQNLLQNAIKFAGNNHTAPWLRLSSFEVAGGTWLEVVNNAKPIASDVVERLFDLFYTSDPQNGMGVGLNIVKRMVERNGGRIWLEADDEFRIFVFLPNP